MQEKKEKDKLDKRKQEEHDLMQEMKIKEDIEIEKETQAEKQKAGNQNRGKVTFSPIINKRNKGIESPLKNPHEPPKDFDPS